MKSTKRIFVVFGVIAFVMSLLVWAPPVHAQTDTEKFKEMLKDVLEDAKKNLEKREINQENKESVDDEKEEEGEKSKNESVVTTSEVIITPVNIASTTSTIKNETTIDTAIATTSNNNVETLPAATTTVTNISSSTPIVEIGASTTITVDVTNSSNEDKKKEKSIKTKTKDVITSVVAPFIPPRQPKPIPNDTTLDSMIELSTRNSVSTSTTATTTTNKISTSTPVVNSASPKTPNQPMQEVASVIAFAPFEKIIDYFVPNDYYTIKDNLTPTTNILFLTVGSLVGVIGILLMATDGLVFKNRRREVLSFR
ncbi:hypothetical protein H0W32_01990 [Patescibacteria group bacterium]|nr:hypothetical protein [Patescibacteria group bacterium]